VHGPRVAEPLLVLLEDRERFALATLGQQLSPVLVNLEGLGARQVQRRGHRLAGFLRPREFLQHQRLGGQRGKRRLTDAGHRDGRLGPLQRLVEIPVLLNAVLGSRVEIPRVEPRRVSQLVPEVLNVEPHDVLDFDRDRNPQLLPLQGGGRTVRLALDELVRIAPIVLRMTDLLRLEPANWRFKWWSLRRITRVVCREFRGRRSCDSARPHPAVLARPGGRRIRSDGNAT